MNEIANTTTHAPTVLDGLAMQAQMFVQNAAMNLLQLGRVLTEARPLVPHGEWDGWVKQNAKMSRRTAEQYMQAYAEFGLDTRIAELGTTKIIKLLPMTDEEREKLLEENDVASMSTRQLNAAIQAQRGKLLAEARAEAQAEIDAANAAAQAAERRALDAENTLFRGHGEKSVLILASMGASLTEEEVTCIRYHMGAFVDKELWSDYTRAVGKYPNVLWTHTADMIASHIYDR